MLIRHSAIYLVAKLLPAVVGLGSIAIYTRLLGAGDYGRFALVYAVAGIVYGVLYAWLWLSMAVFVSRYEGREDLLESLVLRSFLVLSAIGGLVGAVLALIWPDEPSRALVWLAVPLCWTMGWYEINLELDRARLVPSRYTLFALAKSLFTVAASTALAYWGFGAEGMIWGAILGMLIPLLARNHAAWLRALATPLKAEVLAEVVRYGVPMSVSLLLVMTIFNADRLLLGWLLNAEVAGMYSVAHDLAMKSLLTPILAMDLAALPLVVRALETGGTGAARAQLLRNGTMLLAVALPAAAGLLVLAGPVVDLLLGAGYRATAREVFPWIVGAALAGGVSHAYFQHAFNLSRRTGVLALVMFGACFVNIALNLILIPRFGAKGAAYASTASFALLILLAIAVGRRVFPVPVPWRNGGLILVATALMTGALLLLPAAKSSAALLLQIALGAAVYVAAVLALNPDGYRTRALAWLRRQPA